MKGKILIVEDELIFAADLKITLERMGFKVCGIAKSVDQALNLLQTQEPDIVLLDIYLKDRSGLELLDFIKKNYPEIKAIMLTNQSSDNYKNLCEKIGSDHFIDKSSEFENLTGIIESYHI